MQIKKLNLGCGADIKEGYLNIDLIQQPGVDKIVDIEKFPWPFKDNEFEEVYTSHVLEHVKDLEKTMKEIHRICKNNGLVVIRVPHFSCGVGYRDPTHKRLFSYFTFDYFSNPKNYYKRKDSGLFEVKDRRLNFTRLAFTFLNHLMNPIININQEIYERFFCWIFPCSEVLFKLKIKK